ncbi:MAG: VirB8/TrbF family protein [Gammaproteobacteria bacterium]
MTIKDQILSKIRKKRNKNPILNNPYVKGAEGKREWNDRYMNLSKATRNWQLTAFIALGFSFVELIMIFSLSTQSKIQPVVVETNNGVPIAIHSVSSTMSISDQRLINYVINQYIINARTVVSDTQAEKALLDKVYAYSSSTLMPFLSDYYQKNDPFSIASQYTVSVNIVNALPLSKSTWQITWDETKRDANTNGVVGVTRWMADITYQTSDVSPSEVNNNPFGIYITNISWSQSQTILGNN